MRVTKYRPSLLSYNITVRGEPAVETAGAVRGIGINRIILHPQPSTDRIEISV